jgi:hypothetical protein
LFPNSLITINAMYNSEKFFDLENRQFMLGIKILHDYQLAG